MNVPFERARQLVEIQRYDLAEQKLREALVLSPNDADAHAMLGICLMRLNRREEALDEAKTAVGLDAENPYAWYILSRVRDSLGHDDHARKAIDEALQLNPWNADYYAFRGTLLLAADRTTQALEAAEDGLRNSPQHVSCGNLRAHALLILERTDEAEQEVDRVLAIDPSSSRGHELKGWVALRGADVADAFRHFRESLRLDPNGESARSGLVRALKMRNIVYRWLFRFYQSPRWRTGLFFTLFGLMAANFLFGDALGLSRPVQEDIAASIVFFGLGWAAFSFFYRRFHGPIFNLLLYTDRLGRLALTDEERRQAFFVGTCCLLTMVLFPLGLLLQSNFVARIGITFLLLLYPVSALFRCSPGRFRNWMTALTGGVAFCGAATLITSVTGPQDIYDRFLIAFVWSWMLFSGYIWLMRQSGIAFHGRS